MAGRMTAERKDYLVARGGELYAKGFALKSIAELLKITEKTVAKWRDDYDWDKQKQLNNIRPSEIKKMILQYVMDIKEGKKPSYKADDLAKISAAFDRLNDTRKKAVYTMESLDDFSGYLIALAGHKKGKKRTELLELLKTIRIHFDSYIKELLQDD